MSRPRFSEMLVGRRRQLGLSIAQASNVLRLKEQVLIAFEEGDFSNMPKSGYAQGMLSSYARYLGLNSRSVVRQFTNDLYDWERGERRGGNHGSSQRFASVNNMTEYHGSRGLLPTSGGYAGDLGEFATTSPVRSRQQQSSPLVNRYHQSTSPETERRYTSRDVAPLDDTPQTRSARPVSRQAASSRIGSPSGLSYRDSVTTRRVSPGDYTDDLRYDDAHAYEAASTRSGRESSHNIARVGRPNVQRRRSSSGTHQNGRGRNEQPQHSGVLGVLEAYFSDSKRTMITITLVVALILTVVIISSVGSCMRGQAAPSKTVSVSSASENKTNGSSSSSTSTSTKSTTSDSKSPDSKDADSKDSSSSKSSDASDKDAKSDSKTDEKNSDATTDETKDKGSAKTFEETVVKVSVEDGANTWLDIECDGVSKVAKTVTGPWSQEYTVTKSIVINAGNPSVVTVTKNEKQQPFESKTSGLGTMTIEGTDASKENASEASSEKVSDTKTDSTASSTSAATSRDEKSTSTSKSK